MRIDRRFTTEGNDPYASIAFRRTGSEIRNPDGSVVFSQSDIQVPEAWSQVAADILAQKYFRKAGVPAALTPVEEPDVPQWLWRRAADETALAELPEDERYVGETDARQVFDRLAGTWAYWGWKGGYFDGEADARAYPSTRCAACWRGRWARPTARNGSTRACTGPMASTAPPRGIPMSTTAPVSWCRRTSAYEHPQPHACFIQSVEDDLVNDGGIMDLWVREARLFKYGSGTGSNFSKLRGEGERLSGGGRSSGLMSFLKIGDRAAGRHQIRRHHAPRRQDGRGRHRPSRYRAVHRLEGDRGAEGRRTGRRLQDLRRAPERGHGKACVNCEAATATTASTPSESCAEAREIRAARSAMVPDNYIQRVIQFARQGYRAHRLPDLRHGLGFRGLSHGLGPEFQQLRARQRRRSSKRSLTDDAPGI